MNKTLKNIAIAVVVVAVIFFGYNFFLADKVKTESLLSRESDLKEQLAIVTELLALLQTLQGLSLDTDVFTDPLFQSLEDYSVELLPQTKGRENPFAPLD